MKNSSQHSQPLRYQFASFFSKLRSTCSEKLKAGQLAANQILHDFAVVNLSQYDRDLELNTTCEQNGKQMPNRNELLAEKSLSVKLPNVCSFRSMIICQSKSLWVGLTALPTLPIPNPRFRTSFHSRRKKASNKLYPTNKNGELAGTGMDCYLFLYHNNNTVGVTNKRWRCLVARGRFDWGWDFSSPLPIAGLHPRSQPIVTATVAKHLVSFSIERIKRVEIKPTWLTQTCERGTDFHHHPHLHSDDPAHVPALCGLQVLENPLITELIARAGVVAV